MEKYIDKGLSDWMQQDGPESDVVLSSRVRLARNIKGLPFAPLMTDKATKQLIDQARNAMNQQYLQELGSFELLKLKDISPLDRKILVEKHLISPKLDSEYMQTAVVLKDDEAANVMLNEEDHMRIQCIFPGFQLRTSYDLANQIDDSLEATIDYAFDEKLGYLTSCLTNVGTGLRASVMVHIPALVITGQVKRLLSAIQRVGLAVRGYYGEGSEAVGNLFQISNQITLGYSEDEILENLEDVIKQVIEHERDARKHVLAHMKINIEDKIYRSLGILLYARAISGQEAMERISDVRLGIDLGMLKGISANILKELMVITGPGYLQKLANRELSSDEWDSKRAKIIRERLANIQIDK
ncbi:protein arginine kinase [Desulfuribacillus alkaliarsenatis]|uniref:Protein-arginine kinase n=1 Tax=Desulfuribacillus alkaliarsenatis TaxID=766136 RepID=A0A1E5G4M8_9FIRM|nr:protein arginine kinase [Desulfuribacillus alkaliarsenatis]OEF97970.1 protein arginine kinase [Desulfuribacillus alkaliarsenatis]